MLRKTLILTSLTICSSLAFAAGQEPHWDYVGEEGPEHWGQLADSYDICSKGKNQSPIDLVTDYSAELPQLQFDYNHPGALIEINTGHAIQETVNPGNYISIPNHRYELKQFHFHSPSEHTVEGNYHPMEIHFVHQDEAGKYLVVGLMFEEGEHNEVMAELPSFRAARGEPPRSEPIDFNLLILDRVNYYMYNGSLTTPPCTEGVRWVVFKQPVIASAEQIQHYHDLLGFDNNRPIQPLNARNILD